VRTLVLLLAIVLAGCAAAQPAAGPEGQPAGEWRDQIHWIPMRDGAGATRLLYTRICRPKTEVPARLVVISHGTPPVAAERLTTRPAPCDSEAIRWFLERGFVVAQAMRRGYGQTGGAYDEGNGSCSAAEYAASGRETARDIAAVVDYAAALPFARRDGVVLVGQSAGGWGTIAAAARGDPRIAAYVDMAGGRGGHYHLLANSNCRPDQLAAAAGQFGAGAGTRMLWVFTANDSYFAPDIAQAMHAAFIAAGGRAELHQIGPFGSDGHRLFWGRGGSQIWGPLVERYLASP
jgi:dienelactone hydrolase